LLCLSHVIVVLNKIDLVEFKQARFDEVKTEVDEFLSSIKVKPLYYIPISAIDGHNITSKAKVIDWYKGPSFLDSLDSLRNRRSSKSKTLLFPVQDIYKIDDKRIVAGRIESGCLKENDKIRILPSKQDTQVSSVEKFLERINQACAGESIGIITRDPVFINRGDVICSSDHEPSLTSEFKANIFWMAKKSFDKNKRIKIKCSIQETTCQVETIEKRIDSSSLEIIEENASSLKNLEVGQVVIKTKNPLVVKQFSELEELGRFVLEEDENICAGGIVTSF
jgi:sulfate adenylyltransferase subunit 1 (EFTu-like GTPase family)